MNKTLSKILHFIFYTVCVIVIVGAFVANSFRLSSFYFKGHSQQITAWLSTTLGQPVSAEEMVLHWYWVNPAVTLNNVTIYSTVDHTTLLTVNRVTVVLDSWASLWQRHWFTQYINVNGLAVNLTLNSQNQVQLQNFGTLNTASSNSSQQDLSKNGLAWISLQPHVVINGVAVHLVLPKQTLNLSPLSVEVKSIGQDHVLAVSAHLQGNTPANVKIMGHYVGKSLDFSNATYQLYVESQHFTLALFNNIPQNDLQAIDFKKSDLTGQFWLDIQAGVLAKIQANVSIQDILRFNQINANALWQTTTQGWSLQLANLSVDNPQEQWLPRQVFYQQQLQNGVAAHELYIDQVQIQPLLALIESV